MPLKKTPKNATKKKKQQIESSNIKELMHSYEEKGTIGNSRPKNKKAAQKQAVAIALSKSRGRKKK